MRIEPQPTSFRGRPAVAALTVPALAALFALGIGFWLGRRPAVPSLPPPTPPASELTDAKHTDEHQVVHFDRRSLELAALRVEAATLRTLRPRLAVTGTVEPDLSGVVKITPRVGGKITSVLVNVGDRVRARQTLAILASVELARAQAAYREATARVAVARSHLRRQRQLASLGAFGRPRLEEARDAAVAAQGAVSVAENELAAARNEIAEARSERAALEGEVASARADASSAESAVAQAEGEVRTAQAALAQAQTALRVAQSKFNRYDTLLEEQLVSRQDWEQAQADLQRARADVDAAQAGVLQAQAKVAAARAARDAATARVRAAQGRLARAAAHIESAIARQAQVEAKLEAARQRSDIAGQALEREEKIYRRGYVATREILEAEATLNQALADQRAAADQVRLLGGVPGGGNTLAVSAPIAGRITERLVTLGETVTPEKPLFTLVNLQTVWVQLNVYPTDLPRIRTGAPVTVAADTAPGRTFSGAVAYIGDQLDETTRTVKVRCVIQNSDDLLKPRTFVRGTITIPGRAQVLAVPRDAVQTLDGRTVVFVPGEQEGEFRARPVDLGEPFGDLVEIRRGLEPGERLVTKNAVIVKAQAMKKQLSEDE